MARRLRYEDFARTGPGTLAGRYLRTFWQPVYRTENLAPGRAVPIRIMGEDFTLYRGEDGISHLVGFRCAHRGTQLSVGWVEGDCLRCFYHGWKYNGTGQCVEQPAEPEPFAQKVRIPSYPIQEYIGLIFAYLGELPPFPRYPEFEGDDGVLEVDMEPRMCNYFQDVENSVDPAHLDFVHRARAGTFDAIKDSPRVWAEESDWGITTYARRPGGELKVYPFGMPNINFLYRFRTDEEIGLSLTIMWKVPVDDERHLLFMVKKLSVTGEARRRYLERRRAVLARRTMPHVETAQAVLEGKLRLSDIDPSRTDIDRLQDNIAQVGQGVIYNRAGEHLGREDAAIILLRKIWARELRALAAGRPLKPWKRSEQLKVTNWEPVAATA